MERHFEEELKVLKERLLTMAVLAQQKIEESVKALVDRDEALARKVIQTDGELDDLQLDIDDRCLKFLALYQPTAIDLRLITSVMKINGELERIGDQAVNIAQRTVSLLQHPQLKPLIDIPRMAKIAQEMVRDCLNAFAEKDAEHARAVCIRDDEVDALKDQVLRELLTYMITDSTSIMRAIDLLLISRHLERIADHATNIAEDIIYMVKGKDIRHHAEEKKG